MPQIQANSLTLEYEAHGSPSHPVVLLIMGLGMQLTRWPIPFCEKLASHGLRVIRFDNRDIGRSSWFSGAPPDLMAIFESLMAGKPPQVPYTLADMAADAIGLLDALRIDTAHVVGASMGGMIAQIMAADFPHRTLSLTSIMSSTGNPLLPRAAPEILFRIAARPPENADVPTLVDFSVDTLRAVSSPGFEFDTDAIRQRVLEDFHRGYNPTGVQRQMAAVASAGDRRSQLPRITAPTLVLHGAGDPLFPVAHAHDQAACIPDARLTVIPGMGHDLPAPLYDTIVGAIVGNIARAVPSWESRPLPKTEAK